MLHYLFILSLGSSTKMEERSSSVIRHMVCNYKEAEHLSRTHTCWHFYLSMYFTYFKNIPNKEYNYKIMGSAERGDNKDIAAF